MLNIPKILWHELRSENSVQRCPEPEIMEDFQQVSDYASAYAWGGPTSALQLHHIREISRLILPKSTVVDLACGPGSLLLELASLYPDVSFIGIDASETMLDHLRFECQARGLCNIEIIADDIRSLNCLTNRKVDLIISTAALHHLPDDAALASVFKQIGNLVAGTGRFYFFDFGLLRSKTARELFVAEVEKRATTITTKDYALSLDAAFSIDCVLAIACDMLPRPFLAYRSTLIDFCYFLRSTDQTIAPASVQSYIENRYHQFSVSMRIEHVMLRMLRRRVLVT